MTGPHDIDATGEILSEIDRKLATLLRVEAVIAGLLALWSVVGVAVAVAAALVWNRRRPTR